MSTVSCYFHCGGWLWTWSFRLIFCILVRWNSALVRLNITPVSLDTTPRLALIMLQLASLWLALSCEECWYHSFKKSRVCSLQFSTLGLQPTFDTAVTVCSLLSAVPVILLPLCPASLMHKNSQGHSLHPLESNDQLIQWKIFFEECHVWFEMCIKSYLCSKE